MPKDERRSLRTRWSRLVAPQHEVHAEQERRASERLGGTPIAEVPLRRPVKLCGTLRSVTLRPRAGVPALEAQLFDGTGSVAVVWLGRRQIAGVEPGRRMRVQGLVSAPDAQQRVMFNPRYELVPRGRG